jgi:hypothetical protein
MEHCNVIRKQFLLFLFVKKKAISFVEIHKEFNIFYHVKTFNIFNTNEFIFWLGFFLNYYKE